MTDKSLTLGSAAGWIICLAGTLAVFATYWDEAWHTDVGRDSAWSAPHVLLYGSVAVAGLVVSAWGVRVAVTVRPVTAALRHGPLLVAALAGAAVLAAAPIDAAWHAAYGRDSVLWSPPHMLGLIGSAVLLLAVLTAVPRDTALLRAGLGALLLANLIAVVFEYEAGVPQFSEVLYLPVLLPTAVLVAFIIRAQVPLPAPVMVVVAVYAALRLLIALGLVVLDRSVPDLPIAVLGLAAYDLPLGSTLRRAAAGATATAVLAWTASAAGLASPVASDVAVVAVPVTIVGLLVLVLGRGGRAALAVAGVLAAIGLFVVVPSRPASAHDPGQGEVVAVARMSASTSGDGQIQFSVRARTHCDDLVPVRVVARRAGKAVDAPLVVAGRCEYSGSVRVPDGGRWFVYAELRHDRTSVEGWLPVFPEDRGVTAASRRLYIPAGSQRGVGLAQVISGAAIYAASFGLVALGVWVARGSRRSVAAEVA